MKSLRHLLLHGLIAHAVFGSEVGASVADARGRGQAAALPRVPQFKKPLRSMADTYAI